MGHRDINVKGAAINCGDDVHFGFTGVVVLVDVVKAWNVLFVLGGVS